MRVSEQHSFKQWEIVSLISVVVGAGGIMMMMAYGFNETGMRLLLRVTGRVSFPLFVMTATGSSFHKLYPSALSRWLHTNRKFIGLSFAITYLYHFFGIAGLIYMTGNPGIDGLELILSILCYAFLVPMAITSFRSVRQRISPWAWESLHSTGMLMIWYFFLQEYLHQMEEGHTGFYATLAIITAIILPIKVIALAKPKNIRGLIPCVKYFLAVRFCQYPWSWLELGSH